MKRTAMLMMVKVLVMMVVVMTHPFLITFFDRGKLILWLVYWNTSLLINSCDTLGDHHNNDDDNNNNDDDVYDNDDENAWSGNGKKSTIAKTATRKSGEIGVQLSTKLIIVRMMTMVVIIMNMVLMVMMMKLMGCCCIEPVCWREEARPHHCYQDPQKVAENHHCHRYHNRDENCKCSKKQWQTVHEISFSHKLSIQPAGIGWQSPKSGLQETKDCLPPEHFHWWSKSPRSPLGWWSSQSSKASKSPQVFHWWSSQSKPPRSP